MAFSTWHIWGIASIALFILLTNNFLQNVNGQLEAQPWYESLPAVAMDYKVHLDAGKEDCYYQYVQPGASLYVSFQVSERHFFLSIRLFQFAKKKFVFVS